MTYEAVSTALVIATRYGTIRQQGKQDQQVITYQTYEYCITSTYAHLYAGLFYFNYLINAFTSTADLLRGEEPNAFGFLLNIRDIHAQSSCMKAFFTFWGMRALEDIRQCILNLMPNNSTWRTWIFFV